MNKPYIDPNAETISVDKLHQSIRYYVHRTWVALHAVKIMRKEPKRTFDAHDISQMYNANNKDNTNWHDCSYLLDEMCRENIIDMHGHSRDGMCQYKWNQG